MLDDDFLHGFCQGQKFYYFQVTWDIIISKTCFKQVRDTHGKYFGDLDESFCVNPELEGTSIEKFHDEICCQAQIWIKTSKMSMFLNLFSTEKLRN